MSKVPVVIIRSSVNRYRGT